MLQYLWPVLVSTAPSFIPLMWTFSVINWQREPWPVWELSPAVCYHYNKIFDPCSDSITAGSKPKSLDSKCSELWEMVRPKFCGLAQALNEVKLNIPRIKNPLEIEVLHSFNIIFLFLNLHCSQFFLGLCTHATNFSTDFFPNPFICVD